jgi:NADH:ubiquinone reductase (H+-translocating)
MSAMLAEPTEKLADANMLRTQQTQTRTRKRIVIIGGGFAGIAAARALKHADAEVVLIDRRNHHIFQPLLYQAATAVLAPSRRADQAARREAEKPDRRAGGSHRS